MDFIFLSPRFALAALLVLAIAVVPTPAHAGIRKKLLVGAAVAAAAYGAHKFVQKKEAADSVEQVQKNGSERSRRYNDLNLARARASMQGASRIERSAPGIVESERGSLCGPSVLYMSFASVRAAYPDWASFPNDLARGGEHAMLWHGMSAENFQKVAERFGGPSQMLFSHQDDQLVSKVVKATDAGQVVFITVDVYDVLPHQNVESDWYWANLAATGARKNGAPHVVRVLGFKRDAGGQPTHVLLYDLHTKHDGTTIPYHQFVKAMRSDKPNLVGTQHALVMQRASQTPTPW